MRRLLILGAGQYGFVAREVAEAMGCFSSIDFFDDHSEVAIGKLDDIKKIEYETAFVAIGNPTVRAQWLQKIDQLATLVHPKTMICPSAVIGEGCIVEAGAVVATDANIGKGAIVMANAVVGDCCQLKYNCTVPENCVVPDQTKVDCNVVYRDIAAIEKQNERFVESEIKQNGIEPSFF